MLQSAYPPTPVATQSCLSAFASTSRNGTAATLTPTDIVFDLDVPNRWKGLRAVSALIECTQRLSAQPVFRALWRREMAGSTAVGNGFAIPHARITGIAESVTIYVRLKAPVDFAAPDGKGVSEFFVILVPTDGDNAKHLQLLALVAEAFSDSAFRARLDAASDPQDIRSVFSQWISEKQLGATEGSTTSQYAAPSGRTRNASPVKHGHI
jgi:nitrogen PTS system EIIA component